MSLSQLPREEGEEEEGSTQCLGEEGMEEDSEGPLEEVVIITIEEETMDLEEAEEGGEVAIEEDSEEEV